MQTLPRNRLQIGGPACGLLAPQLMQVIPGEDTGVVAVIEHQQHGVIAHWLHCRNRDIALAGDDAFFARSVALNLGAWAFDAQIFQRQGAVGAVVKTDIQALGRAIQADFGDVPISVEIGRSSAAGFGR